MTDKKDTEPKHLRLVKPDGSAADPADALRTNKDGTHSRRVRLCGERPMIRIPHYDKRKAAERGELLAKLAYRMTLAGAKYEDAKEALDTVAAEDVITERGAFAFVEKLTAGWAPEADANMPTYREVCRRWNDNSLARQFPDDVPERMEETTIAAAKRTLERYVLPIVGDLTPDRITLEVADRLKASLPSRLSTDYRRQILTAFKTPLDYCVHPIKTPDGRPLIKVSPLPEGWLPSVKGPRELQWLRPSEDLQLMQCAEIPVHWRVLWGYLHRNGSRLNEALRITISQFDLGLKPYVTLYKHQTKTKEGRFWSLDKTRTAEGLRRYLQLMRPGAIPTDRMFVRFTAAGSPIPIVAKTIKLPELYRKHLRMAGIMRPELYESTKHSRNIVVHDCRATCITVRLGCGWTEADIMQVSGHETSVELARYRRAAKLLTDLEAGDFTPLHIAIPELRIARPSACWHPALDCMPEPEPDPSSPQPRSGGALPRHEQVHTRVLAVREEALRAMRAASLRGSGCDSCAQPAVCTRSTLRLCAACAQVWDLSPLHDAATSTAAGQQPANAEAKSAGSQHAPDSMVENLTLAQLREIAGSPVVTREADAACRSMPTSVDRPLTAPEELQLQLLLTLRRLISSGELPLPYVQQLLTLLLPVPPSGETH